MPHEEEWSPELDARRRETAQAVALYLFRAGAAHGIKGLNTAERDFFTDLLPADELANPMGVADERHRGGAPTALSVSQQHERR